MAELQQKIGSLTSFSGATRLNSMVHNRAYMVGPVDWSSSEYPNAKLHIGVDFSDVSPQDGGSISLYLMSSLNGYYWSGGVTPHLALTGAGSVAASKRGLMKLIKSIEVDNSMSDSSMVWVCNDLHVEQPDGYPKVGDLPEYWGIVVLNQSGCTLPSSGHYFQYQYTTYET